MNGNIPLVISDPFMMAMENAYARSAIAIQEAEAQLSAELYGTDNYNEAAQELVAADQGLAQAEKNLSNAKAFYETAAARKRVSPYS